MEVSHRDGKMPELDSLSADLRKAFFLPFFFPPVSLCLRRLALYLGSKLDLSYLVLWMFS